MVSKRRPQSRSSLQSPDEALARAVALGLAREGGRARDAEEKDELALEVVGDELAAVVVAQLQAVGGGLAEGTKQVPHGLAERLERFEPGRAAGSVDAQALGRGVIDGDEDAAWPSPVRVEVRSVPHIVSTARFGSCRRGLRAVRSPDRAWRQQVVRPHQSRTRRLEVRMLAKRSRTQTLR